VAILLQTVDDKGRTATCDRTCYDAKNDRCACRACGGLLHGIGHDAAFHERSLILVDLDADAVVSRTKHARQTQDIVVLTKSLQKLLPRRCKAIKSAKPAIRRRRLERRAGQLVLPMWEDNQPASEHSQASSDQSTLTLIVKND
jgi:hypothetical protein